MANKIIVGKTADNKVVEIYDNYFEQHGAAHDITMEDMAEAISSIVIEDQKFFMGEIPMKELKYFDNCVEINQNDVIEWRQRPNRAGLTPFVIGHKPEKTNKIVVGICYDDPAKGGDGQLTIFTAFSGILAPQEPWDPRCRDREVSIKFWGDPETKTKGTHALCE